MATKSRQRIILGGSSALVLAAILGFAGIAATGGKAEAPPPKSQPTPTEAAASPTPVTTPVASPTATKQEPQMAVPFGPLAAEPYRVRTGDGDCLNVRPAPGTTFKSDPRTCVPEGFLLWLYGQEKEVDEYKWRYALGEGWVASQYVVPAPGAVTGFGPFNAVTVGNQVENVTKVAKVSKAGKVTALPTIPDGVDGLGDVPPSSSPDGKWFAYGSQLGYVPTLTIRNMNDGSETKYPQAFLGTWSSTGRLLVRINSNCPQDCSWTTGWIDPREGVIHTLTDKKNDWGRYAWSADGNSLYVVDNAGALLNVSLTSAAKEVLSKQAAGDVVWGQLAVSADGKRLLSSPFQGAIVIVDLQTGAISRIERERQILVGGRCGGGGSGSLTTWLDDQTVIWHESYAEKGGNGITIAAINGGPRKLIPFFTVSDIRRVAPSLVSFTTFENLNDNAGFFLTWLLDTKTGEARPVTVGAGPAWE